MFYISIDSQIYALRFKNNLTFYVCCVNRSDLWRPNVTAPNWPCPAWNVLLCIMYWFFEWLCCLKSQQRLTNMLVSYTLKFRSLILINWLCVINKISDKLNKLIFDNRGHVTTCFCFLLATGTASLTSLPILHYDKTHSCWMDNLWNISQLHQQQIESSSTINPPPRLFWRMSFCFYASKSEMWSCALFCLIPFDPSIPLRLIHRRWMEAHIR